jgi:hypothetical protein
VPLFLKRQCGRTLGRWPALLDAPSRVQSHYRFTRRGTEVPIILVNLASPAWT